ncbi:MAG: ROK family protein [Acidobacteriaceae bacterium]|nr:ROK family protein [Acidobacteriaceae bacterium]MBV9502041.1 ROK family protein [Acidobacteriaceae bacterium]
MSKGSDSPVLCVDIGGTSTKAGVLDAAGELHLIESIRTRPDTESYIRNLSELVANVRTRATDQGFEISGIGVAMAGFLNAERDRLLYNSNLSWLEGFPLRQRLAQGFDLPIEMEIDSNAACMAEYHFGSGRGSQRFLCVTCGTGLGVGMTIDGVPLRFAYGCLGDIGHIIVDRSGPLCTCGGYGCAEIMISAPVLANRYAAQIGTNASLRTVIEAAQAGDSIAVSILREAGEWLGIAIASMANTLFPDHIAIAGGLSAAGDLVLKPAEEIFRHSAGVFARTNVTLTRAVLGSSATLIGAAWPFWNSYTAREKNREPD